MLTILVADDEVVERKGICALIRKGQFDAEVLESENGQAAWEIIQSREVDIVITDILMPFLNGLDLVSLARQKERKIHFIVISAYDRFEFAKRALNERVDNYLLKPISPDEFVATLQQSVEAVYREQTGGEEQDYLRIWHLSLMNEQEETALSDDPIFCELAAIRPRLVLVNFTKPYFTGGKVGLFQEADPEIFRYKVILGVCQALLFVSGEVPLSRIKRGLSHLLNVLPAEFSGAVGMAVSPPLEDFQRYKAVYTSLEQLCDIQYYSQENVLWFQEETDKEIHYSENSFHMVLEQVEMLALIKDFDKLHSVMESFLEDLKAITVSAMYTKHIAASVMSAVFRGVDCGFGREGQKASEQVMIQIYGTPNIDALKRVMTQGLAVVEKLYKAHVTNRQTDIVRRVKEVIEKDYSSDLSLESVAAQVYLSPSYLSMVFKRETGENFVKYLAAVRLEKARELLENTNDKLVDICRKVGYSDLPYFCTQFKKCFGVTPTQYRERANRL